MKPANPYLTPTPSTATLLPVSGRDEIPIIRSEELFRQAKQLVIEHQGQRYLLRITRENKLILTK